VAILCAGLAPAVISFAAGQAAFTITLVILFNIIQPAGWSVGLVRLEDVSLGCAVSLVVGLLFWPRGAAAALRKTLAIAYRDSAEYLERAVEFGLARHNLGEPIPPARSGDWLQAAAAYRRLDDALRTYLSERGAKPVPFAAITGLVSGVTALRIAGTALLELWRYDDGQSNEDSANAQAEVRAAGERIRQWYDELGAGIAGGAEIPPALEPDAAANTRLVEALQRDLAAGSGNHNPTVVRMIWTADHLDAMRRLGASLVDPARATVKDR
jgi:Fusaric acid resistance protein family